MTDTGKARQEWRHDLKSFALGLELLLEEPTLFAERPEVCRDAFAQFERRCRAHLARREAETASALAATTTLAATSTLATASTLAATGALAATSALAAATLAAVFAACGARVARGEAPDLPALEAARRTVLQELS